MSNEWDQGSVGDQRPRGRRNDKDDEFEPRRSGGGSGAKTVVIIIGSILLIAFLGLATCIGLFVYGVNEVRKAATAAMQTAGMDIQEQNNYKQIALAMLSYESEHGHFPPLAAKARNGKPGLSWRVALLPYLDNKELHSRFRLNEPWDDPTNLKLAAEMPPVFSSVVQPSADHTHVRLIFGKGAIYESDRVLNRREITDGLSNTFLFVEAADPVLWTQPDELKFDPTGPLPELGLPSRAFFFAAMADGEIRRVYKFIAPEKIKAAITAAGNEPTNLDP